MASKSKYHNTSRSRSKSHNTSNETVSGIEGYIDNTYLIGEKIGKGSYGQINLGINRFTGERFAIKIEKTTDIERSQLRLEYRFYQRIGEQKGFPRTYFCGLHNNYLVLVMDLLGKNLETIFDDCGRNFTLKTIIFILLQLLSRFKAIHHANIVYRDVKPENFLLGLKSNTIHVVDFGLSKFYTDERGRHQERRRTNEIIGTSRYMSMDAHMCYEQSRRSDMESLAYVIVYFLKRGKLPWSGLKTNNFRDHNQLIYDIKKNSKEDDLCDGYPSEFAEFLRYTRTLRYEEEPSYERWRNHFKRLFHHENFVDDGKYDWDK